MLMLKKELKRDEMGKIKFPIFIFIAKNKP